MSASSFCSAGRTRTYDQPVTLILKLLLGMDYIISIILSDFRSEALRALNFSELLPCGIVSTPSQNYFGLGSGLPIFVKTGASPNSPHSSFLSFLRKLRNTFVYFHVTICTKQNAFSNFLFYLLPRPC